MAASGSPDGRNADLDRATVLRAFRTRGLGLCGERRRRLSLPGRDRLASTARGRRSLRLYQGHGRRSLPRPPLRRKLAPLAGSGNSARSLPLFFTVQAGGGASRQLHRRDPRRAIESLPHALDAEQMEACPNGQAVADPVAEMLAFLDAVEKRFGRRPLVYTTREFHDAYFLSRGQLRERLGNERFWLPQPALGAPVRQQTVDAMAIP